MLEMFRLLIKRERDAAAAYVGLDPVSASHLRLKEFTYGLLYDALGWTKRQPTLADLDVIEAVLRIAEQPEVSKDDYIKVRHLLLNGDFNTFPEP